MKIEWPYKNRFDLAAMTREAILFVRHNNINNNKNKDILKDLDPDNINSVIST